MCTLYSAHCRSSAVTVHYSVNVCSPDHLRWDSDELTPWKKTSHQRWLWYSSDYRSVQCDGPCSDLPKKRDRRRPASARLSLCLSVRSSNLHWICSVKLSLRHLSFSLSSDQICLTVQFWRVLTGASDAVKFAASVDMCSALPHLHHWLTEKAIRSVWTSSIFHTKLARN